MKTDKGSIWIDKEFKKYYNNSQNVSGLYLYFEKNVNKELICKIKSFVSYLRKNYFFPIRCNIYFCDKHYFVNNLNGEKNKIIFSEGEVEENKKIYPSIWYACKTSNSDDIIYNLIRNLTFYFQWYFFEENKRTKRSLNYQATIYANYIYENYIKNFTCS